MRGSHLIGAAVLLALACPIALADPLLNTNLLRNSGFESGSANGWVVQSGTYGRRSADPHQGSWYYYAGESPLAAIHQEFDLAALGYDPFRIATGGYYVSYGGMQRSVYKNYTFPSGMGIAWTDKGLIGLDPFAGTWNADARTSLGESQDPSWVASRGTVRLRAGMDHVRYWFRADRDDPHGVPAGLYPENHAYLDAAYLKVHEYRSWTAGDTTPTYAGTSAWMYAQEVVIGRNNDGALYLTEPWEQENNAPVFLGHAPGALGTVNLDGARALWYTDGATHVGYGGSGEVNVSAGSWWNARDAVHLGVLSTGAGTVNLSNGTWSAGYHMEVLVGSEGTGEVNVGSGGLWKVYNDWTEASVSVGHGTYYSGARGTVNVSDTGQWQNSAPTYVGFWGSGEVNVTDGGRWNSCGKVEIGYLAGQSVSDGTVNVSGAGSTWDASHWVSVGSESCGEVNVEAGGSWEAADTVTLGSGETGRGTVNLSGAGSRWQTTGSVDVGCRGDGVVDVNVGAVWSAAEVTVGTGHLVVHYSAVGRVNVTGGTWNVSGGTEVGRHGKGTVKVKAGGAWNTSGAVVLGVEAKRDPVPGFPSRGDGTVSVSAGTWNADGHVTVADKGVGRVTVGSGGTWNSNGGVTIAGGGEGSVTVQSGGVWSSNGGATIGTGHGVGVVDVLAGGTWRAEGAVRIASAGNGRLTVTPDAVWTTAGSTHVGASGRWDGSAFWGTGEA